MSSCHSFILTYEGRFGVRSGRACPETGTTPLLILTNKMSQKQTFDFGSIELNLLAIIMIIMIGVFSFWIIQDIIFIIRSLL